MTENTVVLVPVIEGPRPVSTIKGVLVTVGIDNLSRLLT